MPVPTQNNFAAYIESRASEPQDFVCFLDVSTGNTISYFQLRLRGVWLARELEAQNVQRGGMCAVDMENCAALFYAVVAAAYGGFSLVLLNTRLSEEEKKARIAEIKRACGLEHLPILDEDTALSLVEEADMIGLNMRNRVSQWARRGVGSFDELAHAVVMFTSGTTGRSKAVPLSWAQLLGAARASNSIHNTEGQGIWQLVVPAYHVDGLQIFFRSVLNKNAFLLYRYFNAEKILVDAYTYGASHIALVDKMLQDLLTVDAQQAQETPDGLGTEKDTCAPLASYEYVFLVAAMPNKTTLIRALGQKVPLYASFGMTETASFVASAPITDTEHCLLRLLPGYECSIANPDAQGFGQLGVKGPGVLHSYLNAQTAFTADGFFLTGDTARLEQGLLEMSVHEDARFISGGENVFPSEIRDKICAIDGVSDAYVFGAPDATWGRRPVAFVEVSEAASRPGFNPFYFADDMRNRLATRLSPLHMPDQFVVMDEFPRTGIGKLSTGTLERNWETRIQVSKVEIWHIKLPLETPIRNAKVRLKTRETVIVRISDTQGRTGIGECVAFANEWYMPETLAQDLSLIRSKLAPLLVGRVLLHPSQASVLFENIHEAQSHPCACAALENACWDLYGKIRKRSVRQLIGARESAAEEGALEEIPAGCIAGGAVINCAQIADMLEATNRAVEAGYKRVKLKIKPGADVALVRAVRQAHPQLVIMLDADQSYKDTQLSLFQQLDEYDILCIEEPLDPSYVPAVGPTNLFDRLARLQAQLRMRVCLDESWTSGAQLREALQAHPELRCVALKIAKFGSLAAALEFHHWAQERGIEAWPGGMYESGVSKRLHAAFALLPGVHILGDFTTSTSYFTVDICKPPFVLEQGILQLNTSEAPFGLGCELNEEALGRVTEAYWVCE